MPNFFQTVLQKQTSIRSSNRVDFSLNQNEQRGFSQQALTFRIKAFELYEQADRLKSEFEGILKKFKSSEELLKDTLSYNLFLSKRMLAGFYEFCGGYYLRGSAQAGEPESLNFILQTLAVINQEGGDQARKYLLVHPLNDKKIIELPLESSRIFSFYYTFDALKLAEIDITNIVLESYFEKFCKVTPLGLDLIEEEHTLFRQKNSQFTRSGRDDSGGESESDAELFMKELHDTILIKIVNRFSTPQELQAVHMHQLVRKIAADRGSSRASLHHGVFLAMNDISLAMPYILQACLIDSQGKYGEQAIRLLDEILTDTSMILPPIKDQMIAQLTIATIIRKQEVPQKIKEQARILFDKLRKSDKKLYSIEALMKERLNVTDSINYFVLISTGDNSVQVKIEAMKILQLLLLNQTNKLSIDQRIDIMFELAIIRDQQQDKKIIRAAEDIFLSELERNKRLYSVQEIEQLDDSFSRMVNYLHVCNTLDVNHYFHAELIDNCDFILKYRKNKITEKEKEQLTKIISDITSDLETYKERTFIYRK